MNLFYISFRCVIITCRDEISWCSSATYFTMAVRENKLLLFY